MGQPTQSTGAANEASAVSAPAGFIGWSPDPDRTVYKVTSGNKRGPVETAQQSGRTKQFFR